MTIQWLGHSCFLMTAQDGRTILTDPFDETVGYTVPGVPADVVACSHDHFDHHAIKSLPNGYTMVDQTGVHHTCGFVIEGVASFHDEQQGMLRGPNVMFLFDVDGLRIAHMGDIGHMLTPAQLDKLKGVDVLMLPVGGTFTIDSRQAIEMVRQIQPRIAIPMHYKTRFTNFTVTDEHVFVEAFPNVHIGGDTIELTKENISTYPQVVVLEYKSR